MSARWNGIAASPGYAIAKVFTLRKETYIPECQTVEKPKLEQSRFQEAVATATLELESIRQTTLERLGESKAEIFEGHLLLLRDPELIDNIMDKIASEKINAEFALHEVAQMYIDIFAGMDNELLRARAVDIADVADR